MVLLSLSASHRDLDLATLERLSAGADEVEHAVVAARDPVRGAVVLVTCNRVEAYLDVESAEHVPGAVDRVVAVVGSSAGAPAEEVRGALRVRTGADVPRHLFAVASGLDSMVVGEREVAGQVRRAFVRAQEHGVTTGDLERLFATAARASRTVEAHAGLGALGRSVVGVALDLAEPHLRPWAEVRALLVGTGSYAGVSLAALRARGCADVAVFSATGRAEEFALTRDVRPVPEDGLPAALTAADLVVACSGTQNPLLDVPLLEAAGSGATQPGPGVPDRGARRSGPRVVVDLALRHDVDPEVARVPGLVLVDLAAVRAAAPAVREEQVARAAAIVDTAAEQYEGAVAERAVDHAVVALRAHVQAAVDAEVARLPRGPVPPEAVERSLRRLAATLLHTPSVRARDAARAGLVEDYLMALRLLHGIEVPDAEAGG